MWRLNETLTGEFQHNDFQASVDLRHPENGLALSYAGAACPGLWLGVETPGRTASSSGGLTAEAVTESYVRGRDLIATYAQGLARSVRPQIYWRVTENYADRCALGVELVLSVQSSKLESEPRFPVNMTILAGDPAGDPAGDDDTGVVADRLRWTAETADPRLQQLTPTMTMWRVDGAPVWAALMPHPGDNAAVVSGSNAFSGAYEMSISVFPRSVEKGVIRRSRIQLLLLGGDEPRETADRFFRTEFEAWTSSAPPLTV